MLKYRAGTALIAAFVSFQYGCGGGGGDNTTTGDVFETVADTVVSPDTVVVPDAVADGVITPDTVVVPDAVADTVVSPDTVVVPDVVADGVITPETVSDTVVAPDAIADGVIIADTLSDTAVVHDAVADIVIRPDTMSDTAVAHDAVDVAGSSDLPADLGHDVAETSPVDSGDSDTTEGCGSNCGEMLLVAGGTFMQGCNEAVDPECFASEYPYHSVDVPTFEIGKYEVTLGEYKKCVDDGPCTQPESGGSCNWGVSGRDDYPVNCVDWNESRTYCEWTGRRLCTESEWEKASRGTDGRKYPWGNEAATCDYAVMDDDGGAGCGTSSTMAVGSRPAGASPYGALDMSGNVYEWVDDDWHTSYEGAPTDGSAWVDNPRGSQRCFRGGSFTIQAGYNLRSSAREYATTTHAYDAVGARCCRSL